MPSCASLIGPWPWLMVIYLYLEAESRIAVVAIEDGRAATSPVNRVALS
jgi:hypothetical protein